MKVEDLGEMIVDLETGLVTTLYRDGMEAAVEDLGGRLVSIERLSNVEFEAVDGRTGWAVRSARDPELAVREIPGIPSFCVPRFCVSREGTLALFGLRKRAIEVEIELWKDLL